MTPSLENQYLRAEFDPRGAALGRLIYKPLGRDVVLHCDQRTAPQHYINTIIGPVANRIAGGKFELDGEVFQIDQNEGQNTNHGGSLGLSEMDWIAGGGEDEDQISFALDVRTPHMGFPYPAHFEATYRLEENALLIDLRASSPRSNIFNLAPHFYFNLSGEADISRHRLFVNANQYLPTDQHNIPTGEIKYVDKTAFDFRGGKPIGQTALDHNFCLAGEGFRKITTLSTPDLAVEISSDQNGLQIYDGRHLGRSHIAVEPQNWPNAVNQPNFPNVTYTPDTPYQARSAFRFDRPGKIQPSQL